MNSAEVRVGRSRRARRPLAEQQRGGNGFPAAMPAVAGSGTTVSVRVSECHFLLHRSTPRHAHQFVAWAAAVDNVVPAGIRRPDRRYWIEYDV